MLLDEVELPDDWLVGDEGEISGELVESVGVLPNEVVPVVRLVDTGTASHSSAILAAPEVTYLKQYSWSGASSLQCQC